MEECQSINPNKRGLLNRYLIVYCKKKEKKRKRQMAWASGVLGGGHRVLMTSTAVAVRTRGRPAGILKVVPVSPSLGEFLGVSEVSRTDAVNKVWEYIKHNNLQNPSNKKEIVCDDKLKTIFSGKDRVMFLEIAKLMSQHFVKSS